MAGSPERRLPQKERRARGKPLDLQWLSSLSEDEFGQFYPLLSELIVHTEERSDLRGRRDRLKGTFGNPAHRSYYHTLRAKAYRMFDALGARGLAERIIPVKTTETEYQLVSNEERRLGKNIQKERTRVGRERAQLLEKKQKLERARERARKPEEKKPPQRPQVSKTRFSWREGLVTVEGIPLVSAPGIQQKELEPVRIKSGPVREVAAAIIEKEKEPKLPIGIVEEHIGIGAGGKTFSVIELSEKKLEEFVKERANKIVRDDPRMATDCRAIIESLRKDPLGQGTSKLVSMRRVIGYKMYDLLSFHPRERSDLSFQHPQTASWPGFDMRVIFLIYGSNGGKTIVLHRDGIYTHEQYNTIVRRARRGR